MSATTYGWLVLLFPLLGTLVIGFGFRILPGRSAGWIATAAIGLAFLAALGALIAMQGEAPAHRELTSSLWSYAATVGIDAHVSILVDPLSVYMILIVSGISTMIHLYSISYLEEDRGFARYFAYLNFFVFSMLLLVLAGNFVLLIVRGRGVLPADLLLVPAHDGDARGDQGVRDQRARRRGAGAGDVLHLQAHRDARIPRGLQGGAARVPLR
jgi:NADH-quinone oxidoreductase subunit L